MNNPLTLFSIELVGDTWKFTNNSQFPLVISKIFNLKTRRAKRKRILVPSNSFLFVDYHFALEALVFEFQSKDYQPLGNHIA